jgi:hypothetical protein
MADRVPLSTLYRGARERVSALVADPSVSDRPAPATPGWTVHDVVAHLAGVAHDVATGTLPSGYATPEWTAEHVARGRGVPTSEVVARWAEHSVAVEALLDVTPVWPVVIDAGSHEHDIRGALGDTGGRDSDLVVIAAKVMLRGLDVPATLRVTTEHHDVRVGPRDDDADAGDAVVLRTTTFEAFRWRLGRRSAAQLAAMDWSGDPAPFLPHLCVFGPAEHDVVE